ncbi:DUF3306 domain-containing protein [Acidovorax sp. Leaf78]|uniref:DUF3306 domain-containing protein n=1 Tax=unclassified Acidovorax TaxID=2684926 RepID=UPI0007022876|nr:DUF3306 domain-containing protein [Acidovorax sp. Leaf78]KQO27867.1 hypothetical protein ASF16_01360 [Acidovorax sp. Leaf78]
MADGFLTRWSRRKQDVAAGKPVEEPAPQAPPPAAAQAEPGAKAPAGVPQAPTEPATPQQPPAPTLADAQALTPESDFKPFVQRAVSPDVRNLAMKKLFTDPHFNVMDGLDIYIGDYTQPDPLPEGMLRQMASAHAMGFFDHEKPLPDAEGDAEKPPGPAQHRDDAEAQEAAGVAQSGVCTAVPSESSSEPGAPVLSPTGAADAPASQPDHDHDAHLRLQPDDATRRESVGRGTA